jgi:hypothetical protein
MTRALLLAIVLSSLLGCATTPVQPWQKGTLARRSMALDPDPLQTRFEQHLYFGKEAASGGDGVGGGGCGCN